MSPIELSWTAKNIQNNSEYAISLYLQLGAGDGGAGGRYKDGNISRMHNKEIHARVLSLQGDIEANEKK